jgi:hypothetical protein
MPGPRAAALACAIALTVAACTTDQTRRGYLEALAAEQTSRPSNPVVVVPGFGVTRLFDPEIGRYVWGTPRATVRKQWPDDLDLPVDPRSLAIGRDRLIPRGYVGSRGPINTGWQLTVALEKYGRYRAGNDVYPFYYDWRLGALENARELDRFVASVRSRNGGARVDVVTHSAGAIVVLAWVKLAGGAPAVRNIVAIAPPLRGTIEAFRVMARPERFLRRTFTPDTVVTWPSVPELLPEDGAIFVDESGRALDLDVWSAATWARFRFYDPRLQPAFTASLARARQFRERLRDTPLPAGVSMHVIAGDCVSTARRVLVRPDGTFVFYPGELRPDEKKLQPILFEPGDGTVPLSSAAGSTPPQLVCDGHQGIAADPTVHRALLRIFRKRSVD